MATNRMRVVIQGVTQIYRVTDTPTEWSTVAVRINGIGRGYFFNAPGTSATNARLGFLQRMADNETVFWIDSAVFSLPPDRQLDHVYAAASDESNWDVGDRQ